MSSASSVNGLNSNLNHPNPPSQADLDKLNLENTNYINFKLDSFTYDPPLYQHLCNVFPLPDGSHDFDLLYRGRGWDEGVDGLEGEEGGRERGGLEMSRMSRPRGAGEKKK